ncbi:hypothetical protein AB723_19455, partial [Acinetobacter baumannii]|uniref:hypothetical protein n=1 Tax=Acinetobacter baumannii TaxID=470 RepID=UPI000E2DF9DC
AVAIIFSLNGLAVREAHIEVGFHNPFYLKSVTLLGALALILAVAVITGRRHIWRKGNESYLAMDEMTY